MVFLEHSKRYTFGLAVHLVLQKFFRLLNPFKQLRVFFSRLLEHLVVEERRLLCNYLKCLICSLAHLLVVFNFDAHKFRIHHKKLFPKIFISFKSDLTTPGQIKHFKRNLVFFHLCSVVDDIVVGNVLGKLNFCIARVEKHAVDPLSNKRLPYHPHHFLELTLIHQFRSGVAELLILVEKIRKFLHSKCKIAVTTFRELSLLLRQSHHIFGCFLLYLKHQFNSYTN